MDRQKEKTERNMRRWNRSSIVINAVLTAATILIIWYNKEAMNATVKSADIADSTFQEIKKQFNLENRPFIILSDAKANVLTPESDIILSFWIKNAGKSPALLLDSSRVGFNTYNSENPAMLKYDTSIIRRANKYLESGDTLNFGTRAILPYKPAMYNQIIRGILVPLSYGEIRFKDPISNKRYVYKFCIRIRPDGTYVHTRESNELIELPD